MRGSAWLLPVAAMAMWTAAIGWPLVAAIETIGSQHTSGVEVRHSTELLLISSAWGLAAALGAIILGWAPGRMLGGALAGAGGRGFLPIAVLLLVPICLPAYVVFFAWWQAWPADTWLYRWAVEHKQVSLVRQATLLAGFLCWSWPIVAWCVAGSVAQTPAQRDELLRIDGAGVIRRFVDRLRCDGRGLAIGGLIVFLATFNNTTSFDLAEIFTFGNELRAIEAIGATNRDVLAASMPATLLTAFGAAAIWFLLSTRRHRSDDTPTRSVRIRSTTLIFTALLWIVSVAIPLALLARNLRTASGGRDLRAQLDEFTLFYGQGLLNTIGIALIVAALAVIVAIGLAWMWQDRRVWVRYLAHVQAVGWIIAAAVPGTMAGVAMRAAYNRGVLAEIIYTQPAVLVIGHLSRFAFLGALLGMWLAAREPHALRDLRAVDGAERFMGLLRSTWPRLVAAGAATFAIVLVLSVSEIPVTAAVRPPGFDVITPSILNDMHFQRPQTVMIATGIFLALALVAAVVVCVGWVVVRGNGGTGDRAKPQAAVLALFMVVLIAGCGRIDAENVPPLRTQMTFGTPGVGLGQFNYPRAIAVNPRKRYVYVVDMSARVQRFDYEGNPQMSWQMPEWEMGKPTGIAITEDDRVFLADTHYFRVMAFDADGNELMRFGRFGQGPGQFVYTTDVAIGPNDRIYVSESGGNDRVQVFDSDGNYLFHFGTFGSGPDQFNRPQALAFNHDGTELYVADACNHRIVVTDPEGNVLRQIGEAGRGLGQLSFPYDIMVLPDGTLLVCEFHNARLQRFTPQGEPLGLYGRLGRGSGEMQYPWGVDGDAERLFVLDSGNNRVHVIRTP